MDPDGNALSSSATSLRVYPDEDGDGLPDLGKPAITSLSLAAGKSYRLVAALDIPDSAKADAQYTLSLSAVASATSTPAERQVVEDFAVLNGRADAVIKVRKAFSRVSGPAPSALIDVTLTYSNVGSAVASNVTIKDFIGYVRPQFDGSGFSYVAGSARWLTRGGATLSDEDNGNEPGFTVGQGIQFNALKQSPAQSLTKAEVTFTLDSVPAGSQGMLRFQIQATDAAVQGTSSTQNGLELQYNNGRRDIRTQGENTVYYDVQNGSGQVSSPDLVLIKQGVGSFFVNTDAQYRLTVRNSGRVSTQGVITVVDKLPKTLQWLPAGSGGGGWTCVLASEDAQFRNVSCSSPVTVEPGQDHAVPLIIAVRPLVTDTDITNTATVQGGGETPDKLGNNDASFTVSIGGESSVSGSVWLDIDHDRRRGATEPGQSGWLIEVLNSNGFVLRSAYTDANGQYTIGGLKPNTPYKIQFREPSPGFPVRGSPVNGESGKTNPDSDADIKNGIIDSITLKPGVNVIEQSLPYDPSGVVYNTITRQPIANAVVTIKGPAGFNAASHLVGGAPAQSQTTGAFGFYQFFLLANAPVGVYELAVEPPAIKPGELGESFKPFFSLLLPPSNTVGSCARDFCLNPDKLAPKGTQYSVNLDNVALAPQAGQDTRYFVRFQINPASSPEIVNNHLPLDPAVIAGDQLLLQKTGNKTRVDLGDVVRYEISLNNASANALANLEVIDTPADGLVYVAGSARWLDQPLPDPQVIGKSLRFKNMPSLAAATIGKLTYRMRVGSAALGSDGINRAFATATGFRSNTATYKVTVQSNLFGDDGFVVGKVFLDCDGNGTQSPKEVGVPAVRLYLQDGSFVITDSEGKFSLYGLKSRTYVMKVDPITLPTDAVLVPISNRHAGVGDSRFIDIEGGDLNRADFAIGNCSDTVLAAVTERRSARGVYKAETDDLVKNRLETTQTISNSENLKQLPAEGVLGSSSAEVKTFWQQRTRDKTPDSQTLMYKSTFFGGSDPKQASEYLQHIFDEADATATLIGIKDGDVLPIDVFDFYAKGPVKGVIKVYLNGVPLSDRFIGKQLEDKDRGFQAYEYVGVRFKSGQNDLELRITDPFGNVRERLPIRVMVPANLARMTLIKTVDNVPADGHSLARATLKLADENGTPVTVRTPITIEASAGKLLVEDLNPDEPGNQTFMEGGEISFAIESPQVAGPVSVHASSGIIEAKEEFAFLPELRPMLAVGLIDGMIRFSDFGKNGLLPLRQKESFEKELNMLSYEHGQVQAGMRAAVFLKGRVKGEYLLTLSYDTDKSMKDRLFRDIRPDEFYPVYGDSSIRGFDAQSTSRLYVRIDKKKSYFLYGDYSTSDQTEGLELGRYSRGLTGVKMRYDEGPVRATLFASQDTARQKVEEFAANGTSGPFLLNSRSLLINSERIEVLTRDRQQPSIILQTQTLQRFSDYEVEYFTGRLLFKAPIASLDSNLNPRSIRISYEVETGGKAFWVYGGDVSVDVTEKMRIGSMFARDEDPLQPFQLNAAYMIFKPTDHDQLQLEIASTSSVSTGASPVALSGQAYRIEFSHEKGNVAAKIKFVSSSSAFDNVLSGFAGGREEGSAKVSYRIDDKTQLKAEILQSKDVLSASERLGESVSINRQISSHTDVEVGIRNVNQSGVNVTSESERYTTARVRLNHAIAQLSRATTFLEYEQDVTDSGQRVIAVGGEYGFSSRGKLYLRHELMSSIQGPYSLNDTQERNATVFGIETDYMKNGHVFSEYRVRDALSQREAEAALGVRHNWLVMKGVNVSASVERVKAISGPSTGESTAVTLGADLLRNENTRVSGRLEWRDSDTSVSWLKLLSMASKINDNWTFLTRTIISNTSNKSDSGYQDLARFQVGIAYRPVDKNDLSVLARYERIFERERAAIAEPEMSDIDIFSVHSNYQPIRAVVQSLRLAVKRNQQRVGLERDKTLTYLLSQRLMYDLTKRIDLGINSAMLVVQEGGKLYSLGFEAGYLIKANFWLSAGYNFFGFEEEYLTDEDNTGQGVYLRLRVKF